MRTLQSALSYTTKSGSLYIMKSGCQSLFRHRVKSIRSNCSERFSLSFRKKIPSVPPIQLTSPVKCLIAKFDKGDPSTVLSSNPIMFVKSKSDVEPANAAPKIPVRKMTTVLFGTSQTMKIKTSAIGKRGRVFINQSKSGAKIADIIEMVDEFHGSNPAADDVEKVILSFGANDIKYENHGYRGWVPFPQREQKCRRGTRKFREQIINVVKHVKQLFPGACVVLQSVLPMKDLYWFTVGNILGFNDILREVSGNYNCYYLDCFKDFLSKDGMSFNRHIFFDWLHPNMWGCNILSRCYSFVTNNNSNTFNMIIDNIFS